MTSRKGDGSGDIKETLISSPCWQVKKRGTGLVTLRNPWFSRVSLKGQEKGDGSGDIEETLISYACLKGQEKGDGFGDIKETLISCSC